MKKLKLEIETKEKEEKFVSTLSSLKDGESIQILSGTGSMILERVGSELMTGKVENFPLNGKEIRRFTKLIEKISKNIKTASASVNEQEEDLNESEMREVKLEFIIQKFYQTGCNTPPLDSSVEI